MEHNSRYQKRKNHFIKSIIFFLLFLFIGILTFMDSGEYELYYKIIFPLSFGATGLALYCGYTLSRKFYDSLNGIPIILSIWLIPLVIGGILVTGVICFIPYGLFNFISYTRLKKIVNG